MQAIIPGVDAHLIVPRNQALRALKALLEKGMEIKRKRLRYVPDLEKARLAKGQWASAAMMHLKQMFDSQSVADECQNWVGKVLPEFADLTLFIEHFYDEMDQRLRKLHSVYQHVQQLPDEAQTRPLPMPALSPSSPRSSPALHTSSHTPPTTPHTASPNPSPMSSPASPSGESIFTNQALKADVAQGVLVLGHEPVLHADAVVAFTQTLGLHIATCHAGELFAALESQLQFALLLLESPDEFLLGYCAGKLGSNRTIILQPDGRTLPQPSNYQPPRIAFDAHAAWQLHLARALKRSGIDVDLNRVM